MSMEDRKLQEYQCQMVPAVAHWTGSKSRIGPTGFESWSLEGRTSPLIVCEIENWHPWKDLQVTSYEGVKPNTKFFDETTK